MKTTKLVNCHTLSTPPPLTHPRPTPISPNSTYMHVELLKSLMVTPFSTLSHSQKIKGGSGGGQRTGWKKSGRKTDWVCPFHYILSARTAASAQRILYGLSLYLSIGGLVQIHTSPTASHIHTTPNPSFCKQIDVTSKRPSESMARPVCLHVGYGRDEGQSTVSSVHLIAARLNPIFTAANLINREKGNRVTCCVPGHWDTTLTVASLLRKEAALTSTCC
ncbi:hypothetical protein MHYP_G00119310 [Metynnis hypsauchen]